MQLFYSYIQLVTIYLNLIMIFSYRNRNNNLLKVLVNNVIKVNKYSSFRKQYCNVNDNVNNINEKDIEIPSIKPYITSGIYIIYIFI